MDKFIADANRFRQRARRRLLPVLGGLACLLGGSVAQSAFVAETLSRSPASRATLQAKFPAFKRRPPSCGPPISGLARRRDNARNSRCIAPGRDRRESLALRPTMQALLPYSQADISQDRSS